MIGRQGRMGRLHVECLEEMGVSVVEHNPDFVTVASPDHTHGQIVINQLEKGLPVFVEKPLCIRRQEFEQIKRLGGKIEQNFPLRYQEYFVNFKKYVDQGEFGDIYRVEAAYNYGRQLTDWRLKKGYSVILGGLIHMIDIVRFVTSQDMKVKFAQQKDRCATALCRLDNGAQVYFCADFGSGIGAHHHFLRVTGSKKTHIIENYLPTDKKAALRDFVHAIKLQGTNDLRTTEIALEMECQAR